MRIREEMQRRNENLYLRLLRGRGLFIMVEMVEVVGMENTLMCIIKVNQEQREQPVVDWVLILDRSLYLLLERLPSSDRELPVSVGWSSLFISCFLANDERTHGPKARSTK